MHHRLSLLTTGLLLLSCTTRAQPPQFGEAEDLGELAHPEITEASGLAASRTTPGVFWAHNDSGDTTRVFALGPGGENRGVWYLEGITARDWEDIAVGPGPVDSLSYLYIGEIGDNDARYDAIRIYRVAEPRIPNDTVGGVLGGVETITCRYPDGPRDAEGLFVDPVTRDIYLVSKRETSVGLFRLAWPYATADTNTLERVQTLDSLTMITAADISPDGSEILLKDYLGVYYWERRDGESVAEAISRRPRLLPYTFEAQGEAIAWGIDGAYYTTSEEFRGIPAHLVRYERRTLSVDRGELRGESDLDLRARR